MALTARPRDLGGASFDSHVSASHLNQRAFIKCTSCERNAWMGDLSMKRNAVSAAFVTCAVTAACPGDIIDIIDVGDADYDRPEDPPELER